VCYIIVVFCSPQLLGFRRLSFPIHTILSETASFQQKDVDFIQKHTQEHNVHVLARNGHGFRAKRCQILGKIEKRLQAMGGRNLLPSELRMRWQANPFEGIQNCLGMSLMDRFDKFVHIRCKSSSPVLAWRSRVPLSSSQASSCVTISSTDTFSSSRRRSIRYHM